MKRVYVDMDGVLCDYLKAFTIGRANAETSLEEKFPQSKRGFFKDLVPIEGALDAMERLQKKFDVWILTRPSFFNLSCYTDKAIWVRNHLGFKMQTKLILAGDKSFLKGDYLIDDHVHEGFEGKLILFGSAEYPSWKEVLDELLPSNA